MNRYSIHLRLIIGTIIILLFMQCSDRSTDPGSDENDPNPPGEFSHTLGPGQSGQSFISDREFGRLVVEIQYMEGAEPDSESLDNLQQFLEKHLEKTSITLLEPRQVSAESKQVYSAEDIRSIEEQYREEFTDGETLTAYALYLDGQFDTENVLGIAYYNTSVAFFGETIGSISGGLGQPSRSKIESTVLHHEFGHLMGLVNNGTDAQADHHDSENGAHCTVEECLMYYSVETTDFFANLFDGSVPELDDFCLADVEAVKN